MPFTYFDPAAPPYPTISQPPVSLSVPPAAGQATSSQIVGAAGPRPAPEKLGRDLVFIKDDPGPLAPIGARRHRSALFWAWQLVPLAAWLGVVILDRRRRRLTGDVRYARFTRAGRAARRAIAAARAKLRPG